MQGAVEIPEVPALAPSGILNPVEEKGVVNQLPDKFTVTFK